jgi:hypothetical protein
MDTSPIFEPAEHVFNSVTLAIKVAVMFDRSLSVGFGRYARRNAALGERLSKPVGIISFVAEEFPSARQSIEHQGRAFIVTHLAFTEQHNQRSALAIAHGMQFRVQAALGAPDTSGNSPFFKRLAAVRCAFRWVASIISR